MAQTIKIKRTTGTGKPTSVAQGELFYAYGTGGTYGKRLAIGNSSGGTDTPEIIGGKYFTDLLAHTLGTLNASSAILVDSNSKIDQLKTANLTVNANAITSGSGDIDLVVAGGSALDIDAGTVDLSTQATEIKIIDNSATSVNFTEGANSFLKFDTSNGAEKVIVGKQTVINGDGSTGGVTVSDGKIEIRTGTGNAGRIDIYDSAGNDNAISVVAPDTVGAAATLTLPTTTGDLVATTATQTITNKTLTAPVINNGDINNADIDGGNIDALAIGANSVVTEINVDDLKLDGSVISSTTSNSNISLTPDGTGTVIVPANYMTRSGFGANSLTPKAYVDSVKQALDIKASCRVASTGNVTVSGPGAAIDGVTLSSGDRVLLKDQTAGAENGIYVFNGAASALTRALDADEDEDVTAGLFTFVAEGTTNADNGFVLVTDAAITLGTTAFTFEQFSGAGQIDAGASLTKTGNQLDVATDNKTIETSADALRIKGIAATAIGDLLVGQASNAGYTALAKPSGSDITAHDYILSMNDSGAAQWSDTIDGGTYT